MLYEIFYQEGYGQEKFRVSDEPFEAESEEDAIALYEQHIRDTIAPLFEITPAYFAERSK